MSVAQLEGRIRSTRQALRKAMEESKIDMGLLDADVVRQRIVLKPWDKVNDAPQEVGEPLSFDTLLRDTGT